MDSENRNTISCDSGILDRNFEKSEFQNVSFPENWRNSRTSEFWEVEITERRNFLKVGFSESQNSRALKFLTGILESWNSRIPKETVEISGNRNSGTLRTNKNSKLTSRTVLCSRFNITEALKVCKTQTDAPETKLQYCLRLLNISIARCNDKYLLT